jgi:hypothetical protein
VIIETLNNLVAAPIQPAMEPLAARVAGALGALIIGFRSGLVFSSFTSSRFFPRR